jgi:cation diffusion facilitator CzcD-associated flavoprotein CzcO
MYTNLWANTPRDIMTFEDKPFPGSIPDFPFRSQIRQYLTEYGEEIKPLTDFEKEVINVEKRGKWCLTIRDLKDPERKTTVEQFDAVAIATGINLTQLT